MTNTQPTSVAAHQSGAPFISIRIAQPDGTWAWLNKYPTENAQLRGCSKADFEQKALMLYQRALYMKDRWLQTAYTGRRIEVVVMLTRPENNIKA